AKDDGVIGKLYYAKGDIAKVHEPLFALQVKGGTASGSAAASKATESSAKNSASQTAGEQAEAPRAARAGKAIASPAVRRMAREMDIDLSKVEGSGKKGRVLKDDLKAHQAQGASSSNEATTAATTTQAAGGKRTEAIRGVRAAMAKQMAESVRTIP